MTSSDRPVPDIASRPTSTSGRQRSRRQGFFDTLGPGLITGAADDDPSGISTYAVAGASFGYSQLWLALFSFPLMLAVQLMCARLGMVTGRGLACVIRRRYSRPVLWTACALLVVANVFNIAADLGGMAEATELIIGVDSKVLVLFYGVAITAFLAWSTYRQIARIFRWLTLVLFAYVVCAFLVRPPWTDVVQATLVPHLVWSRDYIATIVGILGTTISPYLFFWQASQEVEEEVAIGRTTVKAREGATAVELQASRTDVLTGMFLSNVVMYFIILTTAATLHRQGALHVATAEQAAEALRPLAGNGAYLLFMLGIVGTGMLGVPALAGACAYAVAEAAAWRGSLEYMPATARRFYAVLSLAMLLGVVLDFGGFNAVAMLFWSAVLNGMLAPPLIVLVVLLTSDPRVMGRRVNPPLLRRLGWAAAATMAVAAVALLAALCLQGYSARLW